MSLSSKITRKTFLALASGLIGAASLRRSSAAATAVPTASRMFGEAKLRQVVLKELRELYRENPSLFANPRLTPAARIALQAR